MAQIFTIALREITRLRKRFGGGASPIAVILLLGFIGLSAFSLRNSASLGSGLYRLGVSGDVPAILDSRFAVVQVDPARGKELLDRREIDLWINGAQVINRQDDKSLYAISALKSYLGKQEIQRVGSTYPYDQAFPMRVGIYYLDTGTAGQAQGSTGASQNGQAQVIIIPSLTPPPAPFTQVVLALLYILPVTFISIFFTSSFMEEKVNRRLTILLSAPVTPLQIIVGKMLPYAIFSVATTAAIAVITHANVLLALAIFIPTTMFIFAICPKKARSTRI